MSGPLCLENICRINLLFRLEEYPVQQLVILSTTIRRDLSDCLSAADVLHYEAAGLFKDFDAAGVVESARQKLLDVALGTRRSKLLVFAPSVLSFLRRSPTNEMVLKYIRESYAPLTIRDNAIPNRFLSFISLTESTSCRIHSPALFLQYCNVIPPKEISVDILELSKSYSWIEFENLFEENREVELVQCDPVVPFLQSFLSQVETIELGTSMSFSEQDPEFLTALCRTLQAVSFVLLYNIITSQRAQQPCLEHINIYGMPREIIETILTTVEGFCSDSCRNTFPSSPEYPLQLATPPPAPYPLKSLSITHKPVPQRHEPEKDFCLDREFAANISSSTRAVVLFQQHSLEHVSINCGTDFCYGLRDCKGDYEVFAERNYTIPEHRELLSTLTDLLKQPQLQSLSVGRAPLTKAYQLVEVFLCTETTHSLSLTIEGVEEEHTYTKSHLTDYDSFGFPNWEWREDEVTNDESNDHEASNGQHEKDSHAAPATTRSPLAQPLPNSNGVLKSLDIGCSCDSLHTWLFSMHTYGGPKVRLSRLTP